MWVLILMIFASPWSGDVRNSSTTTVDGFFTKKACERAGDKAVEKEPSQYSIRYVCVTQEQL